MSAHDEEAGGLPLHEKLLPVLGKVLTKACEDTFDYALRLATGEIIRFREATYVGGDWIHLQIEDTTQLHDATIKGSPTCIERGVSVRLSQIVWAIDAPDGS